MWAVIAIAVALLITLGVIATRKDVAFSLVIVWALIGIAVNQSAYQNIVLAAKIGVVSVVVALAAVLAVSMLRK